VPIFYCLATSSWLLLVFLVFRPLAVSLDLLSWHNAALLVSSTAVIGLILAHALNGPTMAYVQLGEALVLRLAFSVLVWRVLERARIRQTAEAL